ncbi:MAG: chemotaxis protein CheX [Desulfovibrionaceae bacterium]
MNLDLAIPLIKAAQDVIGTMASIECRAGTPYIKKGQVAKGDVTGLVGVTGDKTGSLSISFDKKCAIAIVRAMLGSEIEDILRDVKDAVGEITNMVSGQSRATMARNGLTLQSGTPMVVMGDRHVIQHVTNAPIMAIPFTTPDGEFTIEFCVE